MNRRMFPLYVHAIAAAIFALSSASVQAQPNITLQAGDIIVLDITDDAVYHVDPDTGNKTVLLSGEMVKSPRGVTVSPEGLVYVTDTGDGNEWLLRIDPMSGAVEVVFFFPTTGGISDPESALSDAESNWDILVVESGEDVIWRIDPVLPNLGDIEVNLVGASFPVGLARDPTDQTLVIIDRFALFPGDTRGVHRIDTTLGTQTSVSLSEDFISPRRVAVQADGDILVTDRGNSSPSGGEKVHRIPAGASVPDPGSFGSFDEPQGIAVDPTNQTVLVVDFSTGELTRLSESGAFVETVSDGFSGPYEVFVVPVMERRDHEQFLISEASPGGTSGEVYLADSAADTRAPIPASGGAAFTEPRAMAFEHPDDSPTSGAIYVVDGPSTIVRRDLVSGAQTVVSSAGEFDDLSDIAVEFGVPLGTIVVTDRADGQVIRVDPVAMTQSVVSTILGMPTSVVVDGNGSIIVSATELGDDGNTNDDSGLFRVNPITGDVTHFAVIANQASYKYTDPFALALDPTGDLYLIDRGDGVIPTSVHLLFGTDQPFSSVQTFPFLTPVEVPALPDAVAMIVDGNRDLVIAFDAPEPSRVDVLVRTAQTLMVGGNFNLATDLLFEGMPAPGDPVDTDNDSVPDGFDNCPNDPNPGQEDVDSDGFGDVCQLFDIDLDGWPAGSDNCEFLPNPDQTDTDEDGVGDLCDNCVDDTNPDQADFNADGTGNACQDSDSDTILDAIDVCPAVPDPGQEDSDNDGDGDACDNCPTDSNGNQSDLNEDGFGDVCQPGDGDGDGIPDDGGPVVCPDGVTLACDDNCPNDANPSQSDLNGDGVGDACQDDVAGPDDDFDGWPNSEDNCPNDFNPFQSDLDQNGVGDICGDVPPGTDTDLDGIPDAGGPAPCTTGVTVGCADNCPDDQNPSQSDLNEDGEGDACQDGDLDNDGIPDDGGPAPCMDGMTVACDDNCPITFNPTQGDLNGDQIGDACQLDDIDGDGWPDSNDNCPYFPNSNQEDLDSDSIGDACDNNTDGDGLVDILDNCPMDSNYGMAGTCTAGMVGQGCADDESCGLIEAGACNQASNLCTAGLVGNTCAADGDCDRFGTCSLDQEDGDVDGAGDVCDNCLTLPNAILQGTCSAGLVGTPCQEDAECDFAAITGVCSLDQDDFDSDGSGDVCDNCVAIANGPDAYAPEIAAVSQCDRDSDGYGNACDGDFNNDGFVTAGDNPAFVAGLMAFLPPPPGSTDLTCDGFVTPSDSQFYRAGLMNFFPGPSGWDCAGTAPCPPVAP